MLSDGFFYSERKKKEKIFFKHIEFKNKIISRKMNNVVGTIVINRVKRKTKKKEM